MEQCKFVFGAIFVLVVEHFDTQLFFDVNTTWHVGPNLVHACSNSKIKNSYHVLVVSC